MRLLTAAALILTLVSACDSSNDDEAPLTDITVLFVYAPAVADSVADVDTLVDQAVDQTNRVYRESRIPIRLVPVHVMAAPYKQADRLMVLDWLLDPSDGILDEVHGARDSVEADIVVLITSERSATINASTLATPETAFAIVWFGGLGDPFYAMAHEIGHLQGARHELERDPVDEPFPHGHGFRNDSLKTIMAGGAVTLVPRFSGPDQIYQGVVLGDSGTADVARVLRETATYISNFRGEQTPTDFVPPGTWPTLP